ncbi:MAG: efflux RND transporter periplasmic adaptor subunit [Roseiflexaceae bacterium]
MQEPSQTDSRPAARRNRRRFSAWVALPIGVAIVVAGGFGWQAFNARNATNPTSTVTVGRGTITVTVSGSGTIQPARSLTLPIQVAGTVTEILVDTGDPVQIGDPLVRIDPREYQLQLQQAEATLRSAEARLAEVQGEGATAIEIEQAKLTLRSAEIQLAKIEEGNSTAADLRSAQANLQSAQARLQALTDPALADLSSAETRVVQAEAQLQSTRDSTSATKSRAELSLQQAVSSLTQAQARYATAKQNWEYAQATGNDPIQPDQTSSSGGTTPNKLTDGEMQQYYDTFVQAEATLKSAEASVAQAQIAYDSARQQETLSVAQAEQTLRDARIQLEALRNPSPEALASARAAVTQAQAQLDNLRSGGTAKDLATAQIQVDQARLNLEQLTSAGSQADLAAAEASVAQAKTQLEQAKLDLERTTISAPFSGVIASVDLIEGANASSGSQAVTLVDPSALHIDVNLSEVDAAQVQVGQPVELSFDALEGTIIPGTVDQIAPIATVQQNVVTYLVRIAFQPGNAKLKLGMSATGEIQIEQRTDVLIAPSRAIQNQNGRSFVQVQTGVGLPAVQVEIETGLSSDGQVEITGCVETGNQCLKEGDTLIVAATTRTTTQSGQNRGGIPFGPGR